MSIELGDVHNSKEVLAPTPQMLHQLAKAAIEYGGALEKLEIHTRDSAHPVYYLKDFEVENGDRIGRVARFMRRPLSREEAEAADRQELIGSNSAYSFYYSERIEYEGHGLREEWQAYGYRWDDNEGVLKAARWVESHPTHGIPRTMTLSTASDVSELIRDFQTRQQSAMEVA